MGTVDQIVPDRIAKLLKEVRKSTGLTLSKFAPIVDVSRSAWNRYENGEQGVPLTVLERVLELNKCGRINMRADLLERVEQVLEEHEEANRGPEEPAKRRRREIHHHHHEGELKVKLTQRRFVIPATAIIIIALGGAGMGAALMNRGSESPTPATRPVALPTYSSGGAPQPRPSNAPIHPGSSTPAPRPSPSRSTPAGTVDPQQTAQAPVTPQPAAPPPPTQFQTGCQWRVVRSYAGVYENPNSRERRLKTKEHGDEVGPYCTTWRNPEDGITYLAVKTDSAADKTGWMNIVTVQKIS